MQTFFAVMVLAVMAICTTDATDATGTKPPAHLFEGFAQGNRIDELVIATLKQKELPPSGLCSDEVFVRRVFLDAAGVLPTPTQVRSFLADTSADKRSRLIDTLLASEAFVDCWTLKWGDLLRVKSEFPSNLWPNAVATYHRWIRRNIRDNVPYDRFVRDLVTASGSNFHVAPVNFFRAFQDRSPSQIAENVALLFLGLRLDDDSSFTPARIMAFSAFFAKVAYKATDEWKEEIVYCNPNGQLLDPATGKPVVPLPLDGKPITLSPDRDPRFALADWLTARDNPWFARCIVNRVWFWLTGRGIVHEPDDMDRNNPAWSPELLAHLEQQLVDHAFDLRHIFRIILNSRTYQLSSVPNRWNAGDDSGFSHYRIRRLDAEPLLDAICQVTDSGEKYTSNIPEPFTILPPDQRATALADGSIESPFLEMFGRPPRNTSFESERTATPSVFQQQHLLNSAHIQKKIEQSRSLLRLLSTYKTAVASGKERPRIIEELYIRMLSRPPSENERRTAADYLASSKRTPLASVYDLVWALINSSEFQFRH